jgi:hypothetical protein
MDKRWHVLGIVTYYAFYISQTIIGMELTGQVTDWKIRDLFEIIRTNFSEFYNPSGHLAVDEVIVKFKGRVLFKRYILKKHNRFGIKMFELAAITGKAYVVCVQWGA